MNLRTGFTLGGLNVYPLEGRVVGEGCVQRLQPKSMDVLMFLAENAGAVVEREDLLRQVWGERAQSDEPLTRCIGELRRVFRDTRSKPEFIHTIPKRGYQLIKPVKPVQATSGHIDCVRVSGPVEVRNWRISYNFVSAALAAAFLLAVIVVAMFIDWPLQDASGGIARTSANRSIAVLPFVNLSSDQEQEYFCDGISEELVNLLVKVPKFRVVSRSSANSYKGKDIDIPTMAREMNVAYVLEGSVRKAGNLMRISVQLIDSRSDSHLWSETYERALDDVFATQDEIAGRVAEQLKMTLLGNAFTGEVTAGESFALVLQDR